MKLLEIKNLRKSFDGNEVLHGISLEVRSGEVVAVIGPSGSGKSTLLRCATLLELVDGGEIRYLGKPMVTEETQEKPVYADKRALRQLHSHFGLVFQNFNLFPHFNVLHNVTQAMRKVRHVPKPEAEEKARTLLRKVGLEEKERAYPGQLSGGQQQRVSIARALALEPDILFFDEPTSALDPELTGEILKVIRGLAAEKMTMVIVTHEMQFARGAADRIVFMEGGVIVEEGTPEQLLRQPKSARTREFFSSFVTDL